MLLSKVSVCRALACPDCLGTCAQELVEQTFRNLFPDTFVAAHPVHNHKVTMPPAKPDGDQSCLVVAVGTHMGMCCLSKVNCEG